MFLLSPFSDEGQFIEINMLFASHSLKHLICCFQFIFVAYYMSGANILVKSKKAVVENNLC